jgi:hypothetical protein
VRSPSAGPSPLFALPLLALASFAPSCLAPTQVELELTTDVPCDEVGGVSITVGLPGSLETKPPAAVSLICRDDGTLGTLVVVPSGERDAELAVRVVAGRNLEVEQCEPPDYGPQGTPETGCIVARRTLRFLPHEPLVLPIVLRAVCVGEPCEPAQTCVLGTCVEADVDPSLCASPSGCPESALTGGGGQGGAGGGGTTAPKRVFVSSKLYNAALGGLAGADAKCQTLADAAGLGGTYAAWLSDKTQSPATRFSRGGPWVLVDGTTEVAKDWATLTSGTLAHAIDRTEKGGPPPVTAFCTNAQDSGVFTGTQADGTADTTHIDKACAEWTTTSDPAAFLLLGDPSSTSYTWTLSSSCNGIGAVCGKTASIYCFEQ